MREAVVVGKTSPDCLVVWKSVPPHLYDPPHRSQEVKNTKKIQVL